LAAINDGSEMNASLANFPDLFEGPQHHRENCACVARITLLRKKIRDVLRLLSDARFRVGDLAID